MKLRSILKISIKGAVSILVLLALLGVLTVLLRPYWDLRGNFFPSFNFEKPEDLYDRVEKDRETQEPYGATLSDEDFLARLATEPAFPVYIIEKVDPWQVMSS